MYTVEFYEDKNGNSSVRDYINDLHNSDVKDDRVHLHKIVRCLRSLEHYGTRVGKPTVKHIEGNIWELRPLDDRIFFFYWKDNKYVLLHHFKKASQKTPQREIDTAFRNMANFLKNNN